MTTYTLTYEWDVCCAANAWQDAPLRWLLHFALDHRWPDFQGWELTDDTGYVIAVNRSLVSNEEPEAQTWAENELYTHTGHTPGPWTDRCVFEETIQYTTEGAPGRLANA